MKKVLIITYYWPPSGGAGVQRWVKFVKYLPDFGIEPIVLTVDAKFASYPMIDRSLLSEIREDVKVFYTKSREPFNVYKKLSYKKDIPHSGFANQSEASFFQKIMRFIRGNFFLPDPRKGWNRFAYKKAKQLIRQYNIATVITTSPPHSTQLIGMKLKNKLRINWIADLRDPWTDIYYYNKLYHTALAKKIDSGYEKKVLTQADKVIVVSEAIKKQFVLKKPGAKESGFFIIPNGFDDRDFKDNSAVENKKFVITYTGTIASDYHIDSFLQAVQKLIQEVGREAVTLRFVGVVAKKYKDYIQNCSLKEVVEFVEYVPHDQAIRYLVKSTILFLAIPDVKNNEGILTGKLFEYLGAGKPIIGVGAVRGDAAQIIRKCAAGELFDYENQDGILQYLHELFRHWADGINLTITNEKIDSFSRKNLTGKLASLINEK